MNNLVLVGRTTKDAELSYMKGNGVPVMKFTLAVERKYQKDNKDKTVDFINCEAIGSYCENLCKYIEKGTLLSVQGELNIDTFTNKNKEMVYYTKCKVESIKLLSNKK